MRFIFTFLIISIGFFQTFAQENRTFDGSGNNVAHPTWGATHSAQLTKTTVSFDDGISTLAAPNRVNPRKASNIIFAQDGLVNDQMGLSDYNFVFGQFIDHDITLVLDEHSDRADIEVEKYDVWMDPNGLGTAKIPLSRSVTMEGTGEGTGTPRQFPNNITAFIDASNVYGSDDAKAAWLRTFEGGRLKTSSGNLLPYNTIDGEKASAIDPNTPEMAMLPGNDKFFVAGDIRANENVLLTTMHTMFMREHNRLCYEIAANNPNWNDEQIYQKARKMVGGMVQSIVFNEWLVEQGVILPPYTGYDNSITPQIYNVFSAAAFRLGHTLINSRMYRMDNFCNKMGEGEVTLKAAFFNPTKIEAMGSIDPFIKGMCLQQEQDFDCKMIDDLRNFLFGPPEAGIGGLDLSAINIQRGRERGLADYNTIRADFGLEKYTSISQITDDLELREKLYNAYGSIDNIDAWPGMLAEKHMDNSLFGELVQRIMVRQFQDLRDGDRFFYLNDSGLTAEEKDFITSTRLSDIIRRNTGIFSVQDRAFRFETPDFTNRTMDGTVNNPLAPDWGSAGTGMRQVVGLAFEDGHSEPAGADRPNTRAVSNMVFEQEGLVNDELGLSDYNFVWGQFVDHDITLVLDEEGERFDIPVPEGDKWFDPNSDGDKSIPLFRSVHVDGSGTAASNPRRFPNDITAYLDGSNVYGSDDTKAHWLRTFEGGKLKTSEGNLLPYNTLNGEFDAPIDPNAPFMAILPGTDKYFVAGDIRANENVLLTTIHTLFMREHNRICDELTVKFPHWTDEMTYQQARRYVGAEIQAISYNEWMPTMGLTLTPYEGYNPEMKAQIYNSFAAAAFRYGHTIINSKLLRVNNDNYETSEDTLLLRDAFFNPAALAATGEIEPYLMGMSKQIEQKLDCKLIDDLRNFLFGPPGSGGMDLAAINMQRGRERGLADYNTVREQMGLEPKSSFVAISSDFQLNQALYNIYQEMDKIDLWTGLLAEDHLENSIFGELAHLILSKQFQDIRDGDRFFFENDRMLTEEEKAEIRKTKLSDIIKRNTGLTNIKTDVFVADTIFVHKNPDGITEIDDNISTLTLFPNPTTDVTNISFISSKASDGQIEVTNLFGQKVYNKDINITIGNQSYNLDMTSFVTGVYYITIHTPNGIMTSKMIKQ